MLSQEERRATWQRRVLEQQASGLTISAWCVQQDIQESAYYYWRRRLTADSAPAPLSQWAVVVPEAGSGLTLRVGRVAIEVIPGFDARLLAEVLQVLEVSRC